jgi:hypothetical protein
MIPIPLLVSRPRYVLNAGAVTALALGTAHSAFIAAGVLYMFGDNQYGTTAILLDYSIGPWAKSFLLQGELKLLRVWGRTFC